MIYLTKIFPPVQSIATVSGKLLKFNFLTDSHPKSSNAITSHEEMHFEASAPAPPMAQR